MDAAEARTVTQEALDNVTTQDETSLQELQDAIDTKIKGLCEYADKAINDAAKSRRRGARITYSERIAAYRNTHEEVYFIESVADLVVDGLEKILKSDNFKVSRLTEEVVDYRDPHDSLPEYYDTTFDISW